MSYEDMAMIRGVPTVADIMNLSLNRRMASDLISYINYKSHNQINAMFGS